MYIYQTMSNNFGYLDIILLGMIAGFIILRLRSILGRKTGHETKVYPNFAEKKFSMPQKDTKAAEQNLEILFYLFPLRFPGFVFLVPHLVEVH